MVVLSAGKAVALDNEERIERKRELDVFIAAGDKDPIWTLNLVSLNI